MNRMLRVVVVSALGTAAFGSLFAPTANASCVSQDQIGGAVWQLKPSGTNASAFGQTLVAFTTSDTIVGFWHVEFVAKGNTNGIPDGTPIDSAYVQWHSDGTEIMNSSRDPRTSSFCLGVWKRTGVFTYTLKHVALSWDGSGNPVGPAIIIENVRLARDGDSFRGTFTITQYATDGTTVLPPTPIVGTLVGTRITPN
jgi:hypothetical protein